MYIVTGIRQDSTLTFLLSLKYTITAWWLISVIQNRAQHKGNVNTTKNCGPCVVFCAETLKWEADIFKHVLEVAT